MEKSVEILHKEIDLIQSCIKKYDDRSILIKGWSIALVTLICGISNTDIIIFDAKATPVALSLLLVVNYSFNLIDINNSRKKFLFTELYKWTINNRPFDETIWEHLYNLDYSRFNKKLSEFSPSKFSKNVYNLTWGFILSLMVWHTINGFENRPNVKIKEKKESPAANRR